MTDDSLAAPPQPSTPETELPSAAAKPPPKEFTIDVYRDWCKGCGLCAAFCQRHVLDRNASGGPVVARPERCIGCGWCELHCPDFAISVRPKKPIAVPEDAD